MDLTAGAAGGLGGESTGPTAPPWRCSFFPRRCCSFVRGINVRRKRRRHSRDHRTAAGGNGSGKSRSEAVGSAVAAPPDCPATPGGGEDGRRSQPRRAGKTHAKVMPARASGAILPGFFSGLGRFPACIFPQTGFNYHVPCCGQTSYRFHHRGGEEAWPKPPPPPRSP